MRALLTTIIMAVALSATTTKMKTRITMIVALLLSVASLFAGNTEKPKASFILVIEDGVIKVCDAKGQDLGRIHLDGFRLMYADEPYEPPYTQDTLRHIALDAIAAAISGNGNRENIVDPLAKVATADEAGTDNNPITMTMEAGQLFAILRDSFKACGETCHGKRYRAEIVKYTAEEVKGFKKEQPHLHVPSQSAAPTGREWITRNNVSKEGLFEVALDSPLITDTPYQLPQASNPFFNEQMERMINDPVYNDDKTNNYRVRRLYLRGEFFGYIIVLFREAKAPTMVPAGGTAREWMAHNAPLAGRVFECTFDKPLLTETPYEPPQKDDPYYNEHWENEVINHDALRVYERGVFIGYAAFAYYPDSPLAGEPRKL
jgi:hypothetical protein